MKEARKKRLERGLNLIVVVLIVVPGRDMNPDEHVDAV